MKLPVSSYKKQRGVVIIVALVMLLGMTILSITSMTNSTLEERMSANLRDREIALQAAEAALRFGERRAPTIAKGAFNATCNNGYCDFDINSAPTGGYPKYWTDPTLDVWNPANTRSIVVNDANFAEVSSPPRIIIEYMGKQMQKPEDGVVLKSDPPIYRITAIGYGQSATTRVMLQSTFIPN